MTRTGLVVVAAVVFSLARPAAAITLEQALSAPWTSQLVAARAAPRLAWVTERRGPSNIFIADAPRYEPRQLTHYTEDEGLSIQDLTISNDGKTVVFARRAGGPNDKGEVGNPTADVSERPRHELVAIDVATGVARQLTADHVRIPSQISPDGKWVAWSGRELTIASLTDDRKPRKVPAVHGTIGRLAWSPDSKAIAFEAMRGGHGFIALYRPGEDRLRYLAPSLDSDFLPRWSPDGKTLAFVRSLGAPQGAALIPQTATPFEIWIADVAGGSARRVFASGPAFIDGYPEMTGDKSFFYTGDRVVFAWEHDGRSHLYALATAGSAAPRLLTPGAFDVDDAQLAPDRGALVYASNQDDIDRRHLWRVRLDGGAPEALTRGDSIEWAPVMTPDGRVLCLSSTATTPGVPTEVARAQRRALVPPPADLPSRDYVVPRQVIVKAADGTEAHAQVFMPKGGGKHGALLYLHGGPVRQMMLGFHDLRYYHYVYAMNQYLASHGYVVMSLNYRGGINYGHAFREPPQGGWRGNVEIAEIRAAGQYLAALPEVDPRRVGVFGASNGGYLTVMALAKDPQLWAAGVDVMGVHDWSALMMRWVDSAASDFDAFKKLAVASSPISHIGTLKAPLLLIASDDDRNVPVSQAEDFLARLRGARVPVETLMIPDEEHFLDRWQTWTTIVRATAEFMDRKLPARR